MGIQSDYTNTQLYDLVRQAARQVRPQRPEKLSTREFDRARRLIGHPNAPSGRWIAKRLGRPWPELLTLVADGDRDVTMSDSAARRSTAEKWLDERHLHFALRYVARERAEDSFTATDYDITVEKIVSARKHSVGAGDKLSTLFPTSGQIIQIVRRIEARDAPTPGAANSGDEQDDDGTEKRKPKAKAGAKPKAKRTLLPQVDEAELNGEAPLGRWNKALVLAGLKAYEANAKRGVNWIYAIHLYIEATGLLPSSCNELKRFATAADFSLERVERRSPAPYFPAVAQYRAEHGLVMPDEISNPRARPPFDLSVIPDDLPKPVSPRDWASYEEAVIEALCEYLDTVARRGRKQPSQHDYRAQQKGRRSEWPTASTLGRVGPKSFTAWIERAAPEWEKRRKAKKAA